MTGNFELFLKNPFKEKDVNFSTKLHHETTLSQNLNLKLEMYVIKNILFVKLFYCFLILFVNTLSNKLLADWPQFRGPTGDGRVKPDVMAPGGAIMSAIARTGNEYDAYPDW